MRPFVSAIALTWAVAASGQPAPEAALWVEAEGAEGVFVNGVNVYDREEPCYDYAEHRLELDDATFLRRGENAISTGKTPLIDGHMVHGMEVQWPGIQMKIRYRPDQSR